MQKWKAWARKLKHETYALYLAYRDPRTPWYVKVLCFFIVAYTFSPIDLIPDFIPVFGFLDDLIITPGGLWLAVRLIPPEVLADARRQAVLQTDRVDAMGRTGLIMVLAVWLIGLAIAIVLFWKILR